MYCVPTSTDIVVNKNDKNPCSQRLTFWCRKIDHKQKVMKLHHKLEDEQVFYFLKRANYLATLLTNTPLTYNDLHQTKYVFQRKDILDLPSPHFPSWHSCMLPGLSLWPVSTVFHKVTPVPWEDMNSLLGYFLYLSSELRLLFPERLS